MNPIKRHPLRKIAESALTSHFGELDADIRNALATSLVRQWLTNNGYAGLVTATHQHWVRLVPRESGELEVGLSVGNANWPILSQKRHVDEDKIPDLHHRLNLCQSVLCRNADGQTICLRIEPKERTVKCQEQPEKDEATDP